MGACFSRQLVRCPCLRPTSSAGKKERKNGRNDNDRISGNDVGVKISTVQPGLGRRIKRIRGRRRKALSSHVISNPAFQGSLDHGWSDAVSVLDSEHDEFYSVHEDGFSVVGSEQARDGQVTPVFADGVSVGGGGDDETHVTTATASNDHYNHHGVGCGLLSGSCLPCLACSSSAAASVDKKRPSNPGTPNSRKKSAVRLSFRWREDLHLTPPLLSPKAFARRPVAGATVPYCPADKRMPDCWSFLEPGSIKVRGQNYFRDKKKDFAPNCAAFHPFGVDLFLSPRKIHHIAQFVEFPVVNASDEAPSILVVNVQIPLYPAAIFQSENDGEGMSLVMYFKLSESYSKELPAQFRENLTRLIDDEVERVKSFPVDTIVPLRERLKILGRLQNVDDLQLTATEKKLISTYNEKPVLSRPQHEFYLGENYFEIDVDMHRFSYVSRKGIQAIQDRFKLCVLDFGLTIQGNKAEDVPEHILCCIRLNQIDYTKYGPLA